MPSVRPSVPHGPTLYTPDASAVEPKVGGDCLYPEPLQIASAEVLIGRYVRSNRIAPGADAVGSSWLFGDTWGTQSVRLVPRSDIARLGLGAKTAHRLAELEAWALSQPYQRDPQAATADLLRARWDRANAYSTALAGWKATVTDCGHRSCLPGACKYRQAG
jgi:hypothetical protein